MKSVRVSRRNGVTVELCGIAAMQWEEGLGLRRKNVRIQDYLSDVVSWARNYTDDAQRSLAESPLMSHEDDLVIRCGAYRSATILYIVQPTLITIFWMAGFFREPVSSAGPATLHN